MPKSSNGKHPEGLFLDPTTQKWQISKKLGTGACGTVHSLLKVSGKASSTKYAVKLAVLPPPSTNKKKKKTAMEKNADLLNHENILYRSVLNNLRGQMIPDVPLAGGKGPVGFGDLKVDGSENGFRFLVMEQMEASFQSLVSRLVHASKSKSTPTAVEIGSVAVRLIQLMEGVHSTHHVFVDVKPDNFMISSSTARTSTKIADLIRMIDLGLMESSRDVMKNKHRADQHPDAQLVGTPIYASLNVLSGHTVSRRDDLEACLYIIMELILQIRHFSSTGGIISENLLSWSAAKSDGEVKRLKEEAMHLETGSMWTLLGRDGNQSLSDAVKQIFEIITNLEFKEKPDYDDLARRVSKWKVRLSVGKKSSKAKARDSTNSSTTGAVAGAGSSIRSTTSSKRKGRNVAPSSKSTEPESHSSPSSSPKSFASISVSSSSRAARAAARSALREAESSSSQDRADVEIDDESESDIEMISIHDAENDDGMDWEMITDENQEPLNPARRSTAATSADTDSNTNKEEGATTSLPPSLRLECIAGPHRGEVLDLTGSLIIGSRPGKANGKSSQVHAIGNDREASPRHVKLVLNSSGSKKKSVLMVKVFDLKSDSGTRINNKVLPKGSSRQAFVKDKIQVGESVFRISKK